MLSRSGRSAEVVSLLAKARESGAVVIGISNSPDGALAQEAQIAMVVPTKPDHAISVNTYSTLDPAVNYMRQSTVEVRPTGGSQPVPIIPPYLTLRWCIALQGIFPSHP